MALHAANEVPHELHTGIFPHSQALLWWSRCGKAQQLLGSSAPSWHRCVPLCQSSSHVWTVTVEGQKPAVLPPALPAPDTLLQVGAPGAAPLPRGLCSASPLQTLQQLQGFVSWEHSSVGSERAPQPNSDVLGRWMCAYFQRFTTRMVNQVWSRLWCATAPDRTWQSNTEEPTLPIDWIAVWPLLPLSRQDFCSSFCVQY